MPIRTASADAYRKLGDSGRLEQTTALITEELRRHPNGLTRRELERFTGLRPNQVSGRVWEIIDHGIAEERGRRKCSITGNVVSVVVLAGER